MRIRTPGIALLAALVFAQSPGAIKLHLAAETKKPPPVRTVRLVLHPAPAPRPALRYQLLPPLSERRPGNAAVWWNRVPAEQFAFFQECRSKGGRADRIRKWFQVPLGDPREKELRKAADPLGPTGIFRTMERAARFTSCDWQLPIGEESVYEIPLPDCQQARLFTWLLAAKARAEIAEGRFDDAVRTLQTGYALARHIAESPTLVSSLVGIAVAALMNERIEEFIQQPGAPNLYWALVSLPQPLVDTRRAMEVERDGLYLTLPELRDLARKDAPPEVWRQTLQKLVREMEHLAEPEAPSENGAGPALSWALGGYPQAREGLIRYGYSRAEVEAMPVPKVILLYTLKTYEELCDEHFKWCSLPYAQARSKFPEFDRQTAYREVIPVVSLILPAVSAAKFAEARCQRDIAALAVLEALRLYAAGHGGRLPDRLSDISEVVVPDNPTLGEPFRYQRRGDTAVLEVLSPPEQAQAGSIRYEIRLAPGASPTGR